MLAAVINYRMIKMLNYSYCPFSQAGQPRCWFNTQGHMLQLETPETQLAKDFADIYVQLVSDSTDSSAEGSVIGGANYSFEGEERILTLHAVADLVINFLCYIIM